MVTLSVLWLTLALAADDTAAPTAAVAVPYPASATTQDPDLPSFPPVTPSYGSTPWPPEQLQDTTLPEDPTRRVRQVGPYVSSGYGDELTVEARYAWPAWVDKGWVPLTVTLQSTARKPRTVTLLISNGMGQGEGYSQAVQLAPGETTRVVATLPVLSAGQGLQLQVREPGHTPIDIWSAGAGRWVNGASFNALVVQRDAVALGDVDAWTGYWHGTVFSAARYEDLPRGAGALAAYTSLDFVVINLEGGPPPADVLAPILAWTRAGGCLLLAGPEDEARRVLGGWAQPRFERALDVGLTVTAVGLGQAGWTDDVVWTPSSVVDLQRLAAWGWARTMVPDIDNNGSGNVALWAARSPVLPGVGDTPRAAYALLLLGIALVLGPGNLLVVRALRRPAILLLTTPLLSGASAALVVGYGLLHNGVDVKGGIYGVTSLDQRTGTATTASVVTLYAGSRQDGLRPAAGAALLPPLGSSDVWTSWSITQAGGQLLRGDLLLPVRSRVTHVLLDERSTPLRLEISEDGGRLSAHNALGAPVQHLLVADAQGELHALSAPLAEGETARLLPVTEALPARLAEVTPNGAETMGLWAHRYRPDLRPEEALPAGTYAAAVWGAPFRDDLGLAVNWREQSAYVLGVWRDP